MWDYNRYSYGRLNPLKYNDPSGHTVGPAVHDSNAGPPVLLSYDTFFHIQADYYNLGVDYADLPSDVQQTLDLYKQTSGSTEAGYVDMGPGATGQAGTLRDPAVIGASLFAVGRLGALVAEALGISCNNDGVCLNEFQSATPSLSNAGSNAQSTINWLEGQTPKVEHVMAEKHAWDRLVTLSGNMLDDYRAVQPIIQQTIDSGTQEILGQSKIGTVMEFTKVISNQTVRVQAVQTADKAFLIGDAWVVTK